MKSKLLMILIAFAVPFAVTAQDLEIPDYIDAKIDDFDGSEIYTHTKLGAKLQPWTEKGKSESVFIILAPVISRSESGKDYVIACALIGILPESIGNATTLERFQIKAGSEAPVETIKFSSLIMSGTALNGQATYDIELKFGTGNQISLALGDTVAVRVMKKVAYQTKEKITTLRLDTDEGNLTMDVPLPEKWTPLLGHLIVFVKWIVHGVGLG